MNEIIVNGMSFAIPLFIIAVGGIYSERSGVTNLALEGFMGAGAFFGAVFTALTAGIFASTSQIPMYLSLFVAMVGGALYAIVHAVLCIKFKANQVISGVVVNILAMALTDFLTSQINESILGQSADKFILNVFPRMTFGPLAKIPVIGGFFTNVYLFDFASRFVLDLPNGIKYSLFDSFWFVPALIVKAIVVTASHCFDNKVPTVGNLVCQHTGNFTGTEVQYCYTIVFHFFLILCP